MKKILVTTDFSTASKAGLRFAIQLATQMEVDLVFCHCFKALIPTTVHSERIENTLQEQSYAPLKKLEHFVAKLYKFMKVQPGPHRFVVLEHLNPERAILEYAQQNDFQFICMSTRGAGGFRKIIGTHTGTILQESSVPVLAIPHTYRAGPIEKMLYSSDLDDFEQEMPLVSAFAEAANIKTDLAHFHFPGEISLDRENLAQMWRTKYPQLDQVYLEPYRLDQGFPAQLARLTKKAKPSLVILFTYTRKTWFDKWFGHSISESVSFGTKVPMLVYRKKGG